MAVSSLLDTDLVAVSDIDPGPCAVLSRNHPDVPNLGDIKAVDWSTLPDYRVLMGGYPCQPFSAAGHRKGAEDPRHLWPYVLQAIKARRPDHVFLENVRGHLSLGFATVLEDLADAGYEVSWSIFAASSVGAPHRRERLYIYATPGAGAYSVDLPAKLPTAGQLGPEGLATRDRVDEKDPRRPGGLLPTPLAQDSKGAYYGSKRSGGASLADVHKLFPTPAASDTTGSRQTRPDGYKACKDMPLLLMEGGSRLMPTPTTMDNLNPRTGEAVERQLRRGTGTSRRSSSGNLREDILLTVDPDRYTLPGEPSKAVEDREWSPFNSQDWGVFAEAVARWTLITGNVPPRPVQMNRNGNPQLTPEFPEWLMGLPAGYLTDPELGLSRAAAIKLAGNGVVPQAALYAFAHLIDTHHAQ